MSLKKITPNLKSSDAIFLTEKNDASVMNIFI
jgi:hypothetical protein